MAIEYKVCIEPERFEFWAGAKSRMDSATEEQREEVFARIEEWAECMTEPPTETDINDWVWFECDDIFSPEDEDD
jgi:hypothetical protein